MHETYLISVSWVQWTSIWHSLVTSSGPIVQSLRLKQTKHWEVKTCVNQRILPALSWFKRAMAPKYSIILCVTMIQTHQLSLDTGQHLHLLSIVLVLPEQGSSTRCLPSLSPRKKLHIPSRDTSWQASMGWKRYPAWSVYHYLGVEATPTQHRQAKDTICFHIYTCSIPSLSKEGMLLTQLPLGYDCDPLVAPQTEHLLVWVDTS